MSELPTVREQVAGQAIKQQATTLYKDGRAIHRLGSVGANIAEGFNRSKAKFLSTLDIALGEANETENWLYKLRDAGILPRDAANKHVKACIEVQKMLSGLISAIKKRPERKS